MRKLWQLPGVNGLAATISIIVAFQVSETRASDKLLEEAVQFTGSALFLETKVPALVIGGVRNGEMAVAGFGKTSAESDQPPDGKTPLRIGSITKPFTGAVLAALLADGKVKLMDPLQQVLGWNTPIPTKNGKQIRLVDLITHTSGLPREIERTPGPDNNPFETMTKEAFVHNLQSGQLLFPPGTGAFYSNYDFDLLAQALANVAGTSYENLLRERVLKPAGLVSTVFALPNDRDAPLLQGHNFDGIPLPDVPTVPMIMGSGGLHSTPDDMLRWIAWHLDRSWRPDVEMRLLDHAAYVYRDGTRPARSINSASARRQQWLRP